VSLADAEATGSHPRAHRDSWDRLIAVQAALRAPPGISGDAALDTFGVTRTW
jgi:PIN domain nuclease of toxin-antitoxin system